METDLIIQIGTIASGLLGLAIKVFHDSYVGKRIRQREEYEFCEKFLAETKNNPQMHLYEKEKGFAALTGNPKLNIDAIEYLLTLPKPTIRIREYAFTSSRLEFSDEGNVARLQLEKKLQKDSYWQILALGYLFLYAFFGFLAFSPIFFFKSFASPSKFFVALIICVAIFGTYAFCFLIAGARINRAKKLVDELNEEAGKSSKGNPTNAAPASEAPSGNLSSDAVRR